jgi:lysozyme
MEFSQKIINHFIAVEGLRLTSYQDTLGNWTIGVGHLLGPADETQYKGMVITYDQAVEYLQQDLSGAYDDCCEIYSSYLDYSENIQLALLDMCFNLGAHTVRKFTTFISLIVKEDFKAAAEDLYGTAWYKQVPHRVKEVVMLLEST